MSILHKGTVRKLVFLLLGALVLLPGATDILFAGEDPHCPTFNLNLVGARKQMSSEWKPSDQQDEVGAIVDFRGKGWPVAVDLAYLIAAQKGRADELLRINSVDTAYTDLQREATTEEVSAGIKKIWGGGNDWSFFLGAGAAMIRGQLEFLDVATFDDSKLGWYGTAGIYSTIINFINVGVVARYSDVRIELADDELNAGGWHYGVLAGFHF